MNDASQALLIKMARDIGHLVATTEDIQKTIDDHSARYTDQRRELKARIVAVERFQWRAAGFGAALIVFGSLVAPFLDKIFL